MLLYQPTTAEIDDTLVKALTNFPALVERIDKARDLLTNVAVWSYVYDKEFVWCLPSHSNPGHYHRIEGRYCTCPDFRFHRADANGQPVCKHSLAVRAYRRIITVRLRDHLADGSTVLDQLALGEYSARRDSARCRVWRDRNFKTYSEWGLLRWKNDYHLVCYASQLAHETQSNHVPWTAAADSPRPVGALALDLPR